MSDDARKDTNPKDAIGISKFPMSTIPLQVLGELGIAMLEGSLKYGRSNYRVAGIRASVYFDALMRHALAWWEGQDIDPDSGLSHITKAIATLVVMRDAMLNEKWNDDRPPKVMNQDWMVELNKKTKSLLVKYPDPVAPYTEKP